MQVGVERGDAGGADHVQAQAGAERVGAGGEGTDSDLDKLLSQLKRLDDERDGDASYDAMRMRRGVCGGDGLQAQAAAVRRDAVLAQLKK